MTDHAQFVRDQMRQSWGARTRPYAAQAEGHSAHTRQLIALVDPQPGERVLDVATGPGVAALAAAAAISPSGRVVATDLAPEWGEIIAERCAEAGVENVEFRAMGAEQLDLPDASFDVALCQFGLMFVPDPIQALREMRRVLRDGGRLGAVVWSTIDRVPFLGAIQRFLAPYQPRIPPEQQLPTPLSLGEPGLIERHVNSAGFRDVSAQPYTFDVIFPSPLDYWRSRTESAPAHLRSTLDALTSEQRERLERDVLAELDQYRQGEALHMPGEAIYVTAVR
ncbi:MAG: class I SAM-dependent methyltransferase [Chloroflexota bacterium]